MNLTNKQHWFSITRAQAEQGTGDLQEVLPPWLSAYKYKISNTNTISIKRKYNELGVSSEFGRSDQFGGEANVPKSSFSYYCTSYLLPFSFTQCVLQITL